MLDGRLTYDKILKERIKFGRWQWLAFIHFFTCTSLPYVLYPTFTITINVPHRCAIPALDFNESVDLNYEQITNLTIPHKEIETPPQTGYWYYPCKQYNTSWIVQLMQAYSYNISYKQLLDFKSTYIGNDSESSTMSCQNGFVYDTRLRQHRGTGRQYFNLVCENSWLVSWSTSAYMIGQVVSCLTASYLADRFGRRMILLICTYLTYIFGIATGFSTTIWTFIVLRTLLGYIAMAHWIVGWTLMTEITTNKPRSFMMAWLFVCFGLIYYGIYIVMAYFISDWSWLHIGLTCLSLPSILSFIYIPESPRWLLTKRRTEEAVNLINNAIVLNKTDAELVDDKSMIVYSMDVLAGSSRPASWTAYILGVLKDLTAILYVRPLRVRTWIMFYMWAVMGMVYFGIMFVSVNLPGNPYFSVWILSLGAIPSCIFQSFLYIKFNRRSPFILCLLVGAILLVIVGIYQSIVMPGFSIVVIFCTALGKVFVDCAFSMIFIWTPELYPTEIRSYTLGVLNAIQRIGASLAPFIIQLGELTWKPLPFLMYGILSLAIVGFSFCLPETKNKPMFDTVEEMKVCFKKKDFEMDIPPESSSSHSSSERIQET